MTAHKTSLHLEYAMISRCHDPYSLGRSSPIFLWQYLIKLLFTIFRIQGCQLSRFRRDGSGLGAQFWRPGFELVSPGHFCYRSGSDHGNLLRWPVKGLSIFMCQKQTVLTLALPWTLTSAYLYLIKKHFLLNLLPSVGCVFWKESAKGLNTTIVLVSP